MVLKRKDLVKRWGVTMRTVDRWIKDKEVPCHISMTGRYWFEEEEIEGWEKKMNINVVGKKD